MCVCVFVSKIQMVCVGHKKKKSVIISNISDFIENAADAFAPSTVRKTI